MKKILLIALLFASYQSIQAQDFKIVDYKEGFETPHPADKMVKISIQKRAQLTFLDIDKDGKTDTLVYTKSMVGGEFASIKVFDRKEDDWVVLFKAPLSKMNSEDGFWFYQLNTSVGASPRFMVYTILGGTKYITMMTYDMVSKKYISKEYKLTYKNLYPHKYIANKNKIWNHSGANSSEREAYETVEVAP